ncbi:hypothetical protein P9112_013860 [Eukaryota sp. TZLM1-RC]
MKYLIFVLFFVAFSLADSSNVVELTPDNIESVLTTNQLVLVKYYAPWCGHCKSLAPEYEEAATTLKNSIKEENKFVVAEINCDDHSELCQEAGIQGFPTIHLYRNAMHWTEYEGARKASDIVEYCLKMTLPLVFDVESEEQLNKFVESNKVSAVAFVDKDTDEFEAVNEVAAFFIDKVRIARMNPEDKPSLELHKSETGEVIDFEGDLTNMTQIAEFIEYHRKPLVAELNRSTFKDVFHPDAGPIGILFIDPNDSSELLQQYTKIAKKVKEAFPDGQLTTIDGVMFGQFMERLGNDQIPSFSVVMIDRNAHYNMKEVNIEDIPQFIEDVVNEKAPKYIRSEEPPKDEDQDIARTVVRSTFDTEVWWAVEQGFDVLVMYHAPYCGHCKAFQPIIEDLAEKLAVSLSQVKVVLYNADANDVPENANIELSGYPTVALYPANLSKEEAPIEFEGDRSLTGLLEFLKENAKTELPTINIEEPKSEEGEEGEEGDDEEYDEL